MNNQTHTNPSNMNNPNAITWKEFKNTLSSYESLDLQFEYEAGKWVDKSYHITEIKQAPITSVDCGGKKNEWTEVIIQLWEPEIKLQGRAMKSRKALSIIELVEKSMIIFANAEVKIEFGNSKFDTRQMYPAQITAKGENLIVSLTPDAVQCKANGRGGNCGSKESGEDCCTPNEKQAVDLKNPSLSHSSTKSSRCC